MRLQTSSTPRVWRCLFATGSRNSFSAAGASLNRGLLIDKLPSYLSHSRVSHLIVDGLEGGAEPVHWPGLSVERCYVPRGPGCS